jgi:hypothetical protein
MDKAKLSEDLELHDRLHSGKRTREVDSASTKAALGLT